MYNTQGLTRLFLETVCSLDIYACLWVLSKRPFSCLNLTLLLGTPLKPQYLIPEIAELFKQWLWSHEQLMHQSIPSANIPRPPGQTPGEFFEVVKSPAPGQSFPAKARPPGQKTLPPGSILEDLVSFSC